MFFLISVIKIRKNIFEVKIIEFSDETLEKVDGFFDSEDGENIIRIDKFTGLYSAEYLYSKAKELGCNKIALGHHFDDVIETTLLSMLYGSEIKTMMPKLHSENFEGLELIRPLFLVKEDAIIAWAKHNELRFLNCACRFTEKTSYDEDTSSKRKEMKQLIKELKKVNPNVDMNIFKSIENVNLETIDFSITDFSYEVINDMLSKVTESSEKSKTEESEEHEEAEEVLTEEARVLLFPEEFLYGRLYNPLPHL